MNQEPPRHWSDPEELRPEYWQNEKAIELRAQEFLYKPIETLEKIEKAPGFEVERRQFLTLMGASMALASFACARRPVHKIIPYVNRPEYLVPGVPNWYASTCKACSSGCGILAKNREGRPIKLEGNPDHPINAGALCAKGQGSLLDLYDPDRLKSPRSKDSDLSWDEVYGQIAGRLKTAQAKGKVVLLAGSGQGPSTQALMRDFSGELSGAELLEFDPLGHDDSWEAMEASYGVREKSVYHFDRAKVVLNIGADFLGTFDSPVEYAKQWSTNRKLEQGSKSELSKVYTFEPTVTITGASSDERYAIRPEDAHKVAGAVAHEIIVKRRFSRFSTDGLVQSKLQQFEAGRVAAEIGGNISADLIKRLADDLWQSRGQAIVLAGGPSVRTEHAVSLHVLVNLLNAALENDGKTIEWGGVYSANDQGFSGFNRLIDQMNRGQVGALVIAKSNPVFVSSAFQSALSQVGLVITLAEKIDETAKLSDFVLPIHHYLENWGDAEVRSGVVSLQQPTVGALHDSRALEDILIQLGKKLGLNNRIAKFETWHEYLKEEWKQKRFPKWGHGVSFDAFWDASLQKGVLEDSKGLRAPARFKGDALAKVSNSGSTGGSNDAISLALYTSVAQGDGSSGNNPWLLEMPDPISTITWDNFLGVSPAFAKKMGLESNDVVKITASVGGKEVALDAPVWVQPGLHSHVVSMALGFGHESIGQVGSGVGVNAFQWVGFGGDHRGAVFSGRSVTISKLGRCYALAATQGHHRAESRPIINDVTLAEFKKNPAVSMHTDPHLRMEVVPTLWPKHVYKGHRWGMSIDLNACTGCGACVIACQAENNIPVVGRNQVRVSREMHWIRIDRYYSGSEDHPDLIFQPMLCQHCENASCETVCPVLATVHSDEGLNEMTYNRCVGTRYCQNNCPYKVRRFNYFDHWKNYRDTMNLAWNPDVTVRSRGIMEKCTFCVQRISFTKDQAKSRGEKVTEQALKTACQQTCPTEAIVFGDTNNKSTKVSKLQAEPRAFRSLEILNNKPQITYLTKVRNKEGAGDVSHH